MVRRSFEVLALVPARGGSKSIPGKNVRQFGGHPLLAWSIVAGKESRLVQRVVVSTDDEQIRNVALAYGADAPFARPCGLAQDATPDLPVIQHALDWLGMNEGYTPDIVVQLRPTSPLRPVGLVDEAVEILISGRADSVRSVTTPSQNPYKMWTLSEGILKPLVPCKLHEPFNAPRQSLPETYWQTGHVDVFWSGTVLQKQSLTGDRILPVMVDPRYAIDIDDMIHWRLAEKTLDECGPIVRVPGGSVAPLLSGIRLVVFDFDGVFTDNRVYVSSDGNESVRCSRADGLGIQRLLSHGIEVAVLSTEAHPVVTARCRKLRLPVHQGLSNKAQALRELTASKGLSLEHVAYVGNDLNDIECLAMARVALVPADAHASVRGVADVVLRNNGGRGAVREVCDLAIAANGRENGG